MFAEFVRIDGEETETSAIAKIGFVTFVEQPGRVRRVQADPGDSCREHRALFARKNGAHSPP